MADISAVVLTKNEEENIRYCLDSLKWCDEIIVVDSGSEDETVEICENRGAKVLQKEPTNGKFDQLRNYGVQKASNEWIFVLDADEICPKALADNLRRKAEDGEHDAFNIPRRNYVMDEPKISAIWPDYQLRLHRRGVVEYGSDLHDFWDIEDDASILDLNPDEVEPILHFGVQTVSEQIEGLNRYTSIRANSGEETYSLIRAFYDSFRDLFYTVGRNFLYKRGYRKFNQTLLTVFTSFSYNFILYFKKWQVAEKGTDEEVLDKINDLREQELRKYDGGVLNE